jgi:D-alanyl-D-alanine carboxypeptidase/D-alanyl-D-alanine-endopeptidase (penicillin-binding protein 4)
MKIKFIFLLIATLLNAFIQKQGESFGQDLTSKLDNIFSDKFFESTLISLDVYDLTDQKVLYQKNHKYLLHPASNMKILTSAAGLLFLGPDYEFETSLFYKGEISGEVLNGDLYIVGGFDPDFTTADMEDFVDAVDDLGIKEVTGNLYADVSRIDNLFWGRGWMWDDDPSTDAPHLSSLNINDNSIDVFVKPAEPGLKAEVYISPVTNYVELVNETITTEYTGENNYNVTRDWINRKNTIIVTGNVRLHEIFDQEDVPDEVNIIKPDLYFLTLFQEALLAEGISIRGKKENFWLPYDAVHLYSFKRPFENVITRLNKNSSNLSAEMTLYALAEKYFGKPASSQNGIKLISSLILLTGLNPENYKFVDGSGVSHYNLLSAELLLETLKYIYYNEPDLYDVLYDSFPVAGVDGTLETRMKGTYAEGNVHAKTGTISGVSALSGYLTADNGNMIAFSILIQNYVNNSATARDFLDRICEILAGYNQVAKE